MEAKSIICKGNWQGEVALWHLTLTTVEEEFSLFNKTESPEVFEQGRDTKVCFRNISLVAVCKVDSKKNYNNPGNSNL